MPHRLTRTIVLVAVAVTQPAAACLVCRSSQGEQVRTGVADGNVALNVIAVLLPFVIVSGVTAVIHFGLPSRSKHEHRD